MGKEEKEVTPVLRVNEKVIKFEEPLVIGSKSYTEVTMRRPKGKDLLQISHEPNVFKRDMLLISNLCGLKASVEEMCEIDATEILQLQGELKAFLLTSKAQMMLLKQLAG